MREKSLLLSVLAMALLAVNVAACTGGNGDDDNNDPPDAGTVALPDSAPPGAPDAATPAACPVDSQLTMAISAQNGDVVLAPATTGAMPTPEQYLFTYLTGQTPGTDEILQFQVNTPVTAGQTFDLSQGCTQTSPHCWIMLGNFTVNQAGTQITGGEIYLARAGTIKITEAGPVGGRFKATTSGVRFDHFVMQGQGIAPAPDGCKTTLTDLTLDVAVKAPPAMPKPGQPSSPLAPALHVIQ